MYTTIESKELVQIYAKASNLTYGAKIELASEFRKRGMEPEALGMKKIIDEEDAAIKNFNYLNSLGFKVETHGANLVLSRSILAMVMDLIAILLSISCFLLGFLLGARKILAYYNGQELEIFMILLGVFLMYLGTQFFSGLRRFIDYLGFSLEISSCEVKMHKRVELKLEEFVGKVENISLVEDGEVLRLSLAGLEILDANQDNILQRRTIRALYDRIDLCCSKDFNE
ncbi:hypothetical protein [Lutimonas sp.]|uniref:hypothetical protein n=1 Tax=Lutimonas sp. TaxID=1872403 RepID=UPI003D9B39C8